jgi:acetyl esterase/lipase
MPALISGFLLLCACGPAFGQEAGKSPASVVEKDVPYAAGGDQHMLDLYLPGGKGFTTVVFTYGGGWHTGSRKSVTPVGEKLQRLGYGCALLSHRLSPKDRFPAQAEDVAAAFAWVKKNIAAHGGDPKRMVLMGHSSGAHLSLLIATDSRYLAKHKLGPADVAGVVGLSTPVDLAPRADHRGFGDALLAGKGADAFSRDVDRMKSASPIRYISRDLPPTLLIVGEKDFPMLQGDARAFAEMARSVGKEVPTFVARGCDHMGVVRGLLEDHSPVQEQVLGFLKEVGAGSPAAPDRVADLKRQYLEREKKFLEELTAARHDREKVQRANEEFNKDAEKLVRRLKAVIRARPQDPDAFEGVVVLVGTMRHFLDDDLVALVRRHHKDDPRMGRLCFELRWRSSEPWAEHLLKEAADQHPRPEVRGQALYALGDYHRHAAFPFNKKLAPDEEAKLLPEAARCYTRVRKDFTAVRTPDGKHALGELAGHELTRLRNLADLKVGRPAPEIEGEDLDGRRFRLSDYRGKVVVLDFWGHW